MALAHCSPTEILNNFSELSTNQIFQNLLNNLILSKKIQKLYSNFLWRNKILIYIFLFVNFCYRNFLRICFYQIYDVLGGRGTVYLCPIKILNSILVPIKRTAKDTKLVLKLKRLLWLQLLNILNNDPALNNKNKM